LTDDVIGPHAEPPELGQGGVADLVGRDDGDVSDLVSEKGQGNGHIGLRAPEAGFQPGRLKKAFLPGRGKPQQDFAEYGNSSHNGTSSGPRHMPDPMRNTTP
jgi:hypothetical protein